MFELKSGCKGTANVANAVSPTLRIVTFTLFLQKNESF